MLAAAARRPMSYAVNHSRVKCRPSTSTSIVATTRPSGVGTTAASSPGPSTSAAAGVPRRLRMRRISANSPSPPTCSSPEMWHLRRVPLACPGSSDPRGPKENAVVVQAYILIQTEVGKAASVAREIATLKGVTLAEDVTGPYDVIVRAEARNVDELGKLVVAKVQGIDGITRTLTCPVVHL